MSFCKYLCILLLLIFISCQAESKNQPVAGFDPNRDPYEDLEKAKTEAQRSQKYILLDVGGEWCTWCKKLDSFFDENPDINHFLRENFVVVKVNYSRENKNEDFLAQYPKISGYPHLFVLDQNGQLIHSQDTGSLEVGKKHDRNKVFAFLKKYAPKHD